MKFLSNENGMFIHGEAIINGMDKVIKELRAIRRLLGSSADIGERGTKEQKPPSGVASASPNVVVNVKPVDAGKPVLQRQESGVAQAAKVIPASIVEKKTGENRIVEKVEPVRIGKDGAVWEEPKAKAAKLEKVEPVTVGTGENRDSHGRFVAKNQEKVTLANTSTQSDSGKENAFANTLAAKIGNVLSESVNGMDQVDPAVVAYKEIADPLGNVFSAFKKDGSESKGWFKRILGEISLFRGESKTGNKGVSKKLAEIEKKPVANVSVQQGGGILGGIGGIGGAAGGLLGSLFKGGLLKKLPVVGALLGALGFASEVSANEGDDSATRKDKDKANGKAAGGLAGTIGGGIAGAKLGGMAGAALGPIGAAIGAVVGGIAGSFFGDQAGQILGQQFGGWVNQLRSADISGFIKEKWAVVMDGLSSLGKDAFSNIQLAFRDSVISYAKLAFEQITSSFNDFIALLRKIPIFNNLLPPANQNPPPQQTPPAPPTQSLLERVKEFALNANEKIKEWAGVDAKQSVSNAATAISNTASKTKDSIVSTAGAAANNVSNATQWAGENTTLGKVAKVLGGAVVNRWSKSKDRLANAAQNAGVDPGIVAKIAGYESGYNESAQPISKGKKMSSAHGYGQFTDSTWYEMIAKYGDKYGISEAKAMKRGEKGWTKPSQEIADKYRNNKEIQAAMLAEHTKENIEKGKKYGGKDDDANVYAFHNLGDKDAKKILGALKSNPDMPVRQALMSGVSSEKDAARIETIIRTNKDLYGDGSRTVGQAYAVMGDRMRKYDAFAKDIGSPSLPEKAVQPEPLKRQMQVVQPSAPVVSPSFSVSPSLNMKAAEIVVPKAAQLEIPKRDAVQGGENKTVVVQPSSDVTRDIPIRPIAHVASGGMSYRF